MSDRDREPLLDIKDDGVTLITTAPRWVGGRACAGVLRGKVRSSHHLNKQSKDRRLELWCFCTSFIAPVKVYYEVEIENDGLARVGWATVAANYNLGTDVHGFGFGGTGMKSRSGKFEAYG